MPIVRVVVTVDELMVHCYDCTLGHYGTYFIACNLMLIANGRMTMSAKQELLGKCVTMVICCLMDFYIIQRIFVPEVNLSSSSQATVIRLDDRSIL